MTDSPIQSKLDFIAFCSVAPIARAAHEALLEIIGAHAEKGILMFRDYPDPLGVLRLSAGNLLDVSPRDITYLSNTAEGMNIIANGYPFEPGDEIITFVHEYPSNYFAWARQESRGVKLKKLSNVNSFGAAFDGLPLGWSMDELKSLVSPRTKVVALSHVQFASGFAADLDELGSFCEQQGIDLIIDAAQSMGALPIFPRRSGIAAVVSSGWKWLLGPMGSGIMYTSPKLREKLALTVVGPSTMKQADDYLNLKWDPFEDGRRFEYSTPSLTQAFSLGKGIAAVHLAAGIESIWRRIKECREIVLRELSPDAAEVLPLPERNRSGIISVIPKKASIDEATKRLRSQGFVFVPRGGYFRIAPHFFTTDAQLQRAMDAINAL